MCSSQNKIDLFKLILLYEMINILIKKLMSTESARMLSNIFLQVKNISFQNIDPISSISIKNYIPYPKFKISHKSVYY